MAATKVSLRIQVCEGDNTTQEQKPKSPLRFTIGSAGLDLETEHDVIIDSGQCSVVDLGVRVQIPDGHVGILASRSSTWSRYGVILTNGIGVIDSDYRGVVKASLYNPTGSPTAIPRGTRIAQLLILPCPSIHVEQVDELDATARGTGGFGSTG